MKENQRVRFWHARRIPIRNTPSHVLSVKRETIFRNRVDLDGMKHNNDAATDYETMTIVRESVKALLDLLGNTSEARSLMHNLIMAVDESNRRALDVQDVIDDLQ